MTESSNREYNYTGALAIICGPSCTGKGAFVDILVELLKKYNIPANQLSIGHFFRLISIYLHLEDKLGFISNPATTQEQKLEYLEAIADVANWSFGQYLTFTFGKHSIATDHPDLMSKSVSRHIPFFSTVTPFRKKLFDPINGPFGQILGSKLSEGGLLAVDCRYTPGEFDPLLTDYMHQQGRFGVYEVIAADEASQRRICGYRARTELNDAIPTEEQITAVVEGVIKRHEQDVAGGVVFQKEVVLEHYASSFQEIHNDGQSFECLRAQAQPSVTRIAAAMTSGLVDPSGRPLTS